MKRILPVIVISQFFCTSLWFAGNAVIGDIARQLQLEPAYLAYLSSAVQAGFITGTLVFALLSIADRFLSTRVFMVCAIVAAIINLGICLPGITTLTLLAFRFTTGFFLAGIYPVGMKIAADHYQQGLGKSLGYLVGALVIGTAFPHLLKGLSASFPWQYIVAATSLLSVLGGIAMYLLVPQGPYAVLGKKPNWKASLNSFRNLRFKAAAFGYFGHMWELYAFWVFVPVILITYQQRHPGIQLNVALWSFLIIAMGSLSCVLSGYVSQYWGAKKTATIALLLSCLCCLISPLFIAQGQITLLLAFMLFWSVVIIADSPMFSTLVAQNAPADSKGSSLTIVNCIGFFITIVSIQLVSALRTEANATYLYMLLAIGPILGLAALFNNRKETQSSSIQSVGE
ncbi:nitrate/nitrite transporter [Mucilaginibacter galii]|uniref:Membrane protein n=1 Tax=Mucilaginibacter galii TaxID=2005073 RepID=A0A917J6Z2_9SPHI|nr:MFS transporter [Mucilaginibacter galii]GGI49858.1 membrane protein [Mucilaginibacter galii]